MLRLGEASNDIGAVLKVIEDLAKQTGLLALNAAVMVESRRQAQATVTEARAALDAIDLAVAQIQEMNTQIAAAAEEQSTVASTISRDLVMINQRSATVAEGAHDVAKTSDDLAQLSGGLSSLVGQFRSTSAN